MKNDKEIQGDYSENSEQVALIERTKLLLVKLHPGREVEIVLHPAGQASDDISEDFFHVNLLTEKSVSIGYIRIRSSTGSLSAGELDVLDVIKDGFIYQLELMKRFERVGLNGKLTEQEKLNYQRELEDAYNDLNLAHEELSDLFNQTFFLNESLTNSMRKSLSMLQNAPIAVGILRDRNLVIEFANTLILQVWGKDGTVVGGTLAEGLPELKGQPYLEILDRVYLTGERYVGREAKVLLKKKEEMVSAFFNFFYEPIKDESGTTNGIIIIANDVTEFLSSR